MNEWFYILEGQAQGPISTEDLRLVVNSGIVSPETLIWRDGFSEWRQFKATFPSRRTNVFNATSLLSVVLLCIAMIWMVLGGHQTHFVRVNKDANTGSPPWELRAACNRLTFVGFTLHEERAGGSQTITATKPSIATLASIQTDGVYVLRLHVTCVLPITSESIFREGGASEATFSDAMSALVGVNLSSLDYRKLLDWHFQPIRSREVGANPTSTRTMKWGNLLFESEWTVTQKDGNPVLLEGLAMDYLTAR